MPFLGTCHDGQTDRVTPNCHTDDLALDQLLDELAGRMQAGQFVDVEACIERHPEYSARLRNVLPAMQLLTAYGANHSHQPCTLVPRSPGNGVLGDFQLIREVGRGGMGVVFEAVQSSLSRRVALKVLPLAGMLDSRQLARFKNEARSAARLHHTNIVPVFAVGQENGVHYYAMQYIDGCTLAEVIRRLRAACAPTTKSVKPFAKCEISTVVASPAEHHFQDIDEAETDTISAAASTAIAERSHGQPTYYRTIARWGVQAAEALHYAHGHGIVHRDVKPANLILDNSGNLWVTDFGLARAEADAGLTMTGDMLGTLRYMSPEQAGVRPSRADHRSDIYSLGMTLYELTALRCAFESQGRNLVLRQIAEDEPRSLTRENKAVPRELDTIILKCIAKDPEERYASAQAVADELRRFLDNRPIVARPSTRCQQAVKWLRRHRTLAATVAASVVFAMTVVGANLWYASAREWQLQQATALRREREAAEKLHQLQKLEYALDLRRVDEISLAREPSSTESILAKYGPQATTHERGGFEWRYYSSVLDIFRRSHRATLPVHEGQVYCLSFSSDGRMVASASEDLTVRIWQYPSMTLVRTLAGHESDVNWAAFSSDDRRLATCSDDGTARVWDVQSGREQLRFASNRPWADDGGESIAYRIAFSSDGNFLVTMHRLHAKVWDAHDGKLLGTLPGRGLAVSEHQLVAATAPTESSVALWDLTSQERIAAMPVAGAAPTYFNAGRFALNDSALLLGSEDGYLTRFDLRWRGDALVTSRVSRFYTTGSAIDGVSLSRNRPHAAIACRDGRIEVWDFRARRRLGGPYQHHTRAFVAALAPDDKSLLSVGMDGNIMHWSASCDQARQTVHERPAFAGLYGQFLPEGDRFVLLSPRIARRDSGESIEILSVTAGGSWTVVEELQAKTKSDALANDASGSFLNRVAVSPKGQIVIAGHGGVFLRDKDQAGGQLRCISHRPERPTGNAAPSWFGAAGVVFLGERTLAVVQEGVSKLMDLEGRFPDRPLRGPSAAHHRCLAASPDGRYLAIGDDAGEFFLYEPKSSRVISSGRVASRGIARIVFLPPHNLIALGADDGTIAIWDVDARRMRTQFGAPNVAVGALSWHQESRRLASSGPSEGVVRLWDIDVDQQVAAFATEPDFRVYDLAFSPNGNQLIACGVSGEGQGSIRQWMLPTDVRPFHLDMERLVEGRATIDFDGAQ